MDTTTTRWTPHQSILGFGFKKTEKKYNFKFGNFKPLVGLLNFLEIFNQKSVLDLILQ